MMNLPMVHKKVILILYGEDGQADTNITLENVKLMVSGDYLIVNNEGMLCEDDTVKFVHTNIYHLSKIRAYNTYSELVTDKKLLK